MKTKTRDDIFLFLLMSFCFPLLSFADFSSGEKGTTSGQFLKIGVGARATGMGEAYSAIADEASAIYWNPAALIRINDYSATFMHADLLGGISYEFLGYAQRLGDIGTFGMGFQYLSVPTIHETDSSGFETGVTVNPKDLAISLAYSYPLKYLGVEKWSVGISGKFIRCKIDKTASTFAADVGVLSPSYSLSGKDVRVSFVIQNLGGKLKFAQDSEPLPLNVKLGSSLFIRQNWIAGLDLNFPKDNRLYAAVGTEYKFTSWADWKFAGRLGFNSRTLGDVSGLNGLSIGAGVNFRFAELDYAFLPFGSIGITHRFSLTLTFGTSQSGN
ncbi:MAG: PorV/PorQ family protein [Elusimicrobia bacterium]|nr:PorV/PorQ family protein [Elusimicrobiota bacterium]